MNWLWFFIIFVGLTVIIFGIGSWQQGEVSVGPLLIGIVAGLLFGGAVGWAIHDTDRFNQHCADMGGYTKELLRDTVCISDDGKILDY